MHAYSHIMHLEKLQVKKYHTLSEVIWRLVVQILWIRISRAVHIGQLLAYGGGLLKCLVPVLSDSLVGWWRL